MPYINPEVQLAEIHAQDAHKKGSRSTPETWVVAALLVAAAIAWITITVNRSHHTSVVAPNAVTATAAPR
ncbi:MAG TPA: hypothetical protein VGU66_02605 [Candidatus Elarobacter sp.]|nr:hypothetical protein [Candidatus Elarobacter sp.]